MADETLAQFRARYADIDRRLDAGVPESDRANVKGEIIGLFKTVEQAVTDLSALKEEIRALVDKWKAQQSAATPSLAPQFSGDKPVVHADHIGASTFIEKGWSRLSLGD
jgi:outer membrane protein TolC